MGGKKRKLQHKLDKAASRHGNKSNGHPQKPQQQQHQSKPSAKQRQRQRDQEKPTIPFDPDDRILLIGEGDLSFAASIVEHHGCTNVTATVLEKDEAALLEKYPHAEANIAAILGANAEEERADGFSESADGHAHGTDDDGSDEDGSAYGNTDDEQEDDADSDNSERVSKPKKRGPASNRILYGIDATKLPSSLTRLPYDRIIFNFPHVGGKSTDVNRQVRYNQELLVSFFRSALPALSSLQQQRQSRQRASSSSSSSSSSTSPPSIVVTLFEGEPYTLWNIRDLARHAGGLQVERSFRFQASVYPGYHHARTIGVVKNRAGEQGGGWKGEDRAARSFVFVRQGEAPAPGTKKRRRGDESSDED